MEDEIKISAELAEELKKLYGLLLNFNNLPFTGQDSATSICFKTRIVPMIINNIRECLIKISGMGDEFARLPTVYKQIVISAFQLLERLEMWKGCNCGNFKDAEGY